ncbi:MAG: inositol monophosphatase family protein [Woeseiaceae bacterium]|nr:inositol monophosphatase family protein [Woeseiaceae bacterium]
MPVNLPDDASPELRVALEASVVAADISRKHYRSNLTVTTKADRTPVTAADVDCEQAIRAIILEAFPQHGFFGEETGRSDADGDALWLVDPIDGTKGFVREYPFFSTQIALMEGGRLRLGVSNGVMFDEIAWAERGRGAWLNGQQLTVSDRHELDAGAVSTGNLRSLASTDGWQRLGDIVARADRIRGYGDFYHYHLLAAGKIEAVIESDVNILDIAALAVIVEEAGGRFTDLNGAAVDLETRSVLAANPRLHGKLLEPLRGFVA